MVKLWALTQQNLENLIAWLRKLDFTKHWEVIIREKKPKRSLEQNSRLWDLYRSIGSHLGYSADDMHLLMGYKFLRDEKIINDTPVTLVKSTTSLSPQEMSEYQTMIEAWAASMGWSRDE